jgi:hypothetical protein
MKRLLSIGLATAALHCGGAAGSSVLFADDDGGASASEGGSTADAGSGGGGGGGANEDAGAGGGGGGGGGGSVDGGAPSNAGQVGCGVTPSCDLSTSTCCVLADGGAACTKGTGATCPSIGGDPVTRQCDETADCPGGQICCLEIINNTAIGSSCHADCGGNGGRRAQACKQQSECQSGTCQVRTCSAGGPIESCGPLSSLCP